MRSTIAAALSALPLLFACGGATSTPTHAHGAHHGSETTAAFRAHHAEIRAELDEAADRAMALPAAPPEQVDELIHGIVHFFQHELMPHAEAEERVLYAAADRLVPTAHGRRYTDALRYEHTVVAREVQALHDAMERGDHSPEALADIQRRTLELVGLVKAHFGAEEDVVLAAFDELMSPEEFRRQVVEPMHGAPPNEGASEDHHHHAR